MNAFKVSLLQFLFVIEPRPCIWNRENPFSIVYLFAQQQHSNNSNLKMKKKTSHATWNKWKILKMTKEKTKKKMLIKDGTHQLCYVLRVGKLIAVSLWTFSVFIIAFESKDDNKKMETRDIQFGVRFFHSFSPINVNMQFMKRDSFHSLPFNYL